MLDIFIYFYFVSACCVQSAELKNSCNFDTAEINFLPSDLHVCIFCCSVVEKKRNKTQKDSPGFPYTTKSKIHIKLESLYKNKDHIQCSWKKKIVISVLKILETLKYFCLLDVSRPCTIQLNASSLNNSCRETYRFCPIFYFVVKLTDRLQEVCNKTSAAFAL